jgi:uncharacterized protein YcbX
MPITLARIARYPVKGLNAEELTRVTLEPGRAMAHDRRFALAHGSTRFDPGAPEWLPKTNFLMLMKNERLAALDARFDDGTDELVVHRNGKPVARGRLTDPMGRTVIEQFFAAYLGAEARGKPRVVEGPPGFTFSDHRSPVISIINRASVADVERVAEAPVDPRRFRGNLLIEGAEPWVEMSWVGREIAIGPVRLRIASAIDRCAATTVNPDTAQRDVNVPRALQKGFGHIDCGVYGEVIAGGEIAVGDVVTA